MISLRPYQQRMIDETREAMRQHRRVLLQAPTGAGKTAITVHMMGESANRGISSVFCVHQNELLRQTSAALWKQSLEHGVIAAGRVASKLPAQVASMQTLVRRLDKYPEPALLIVDECHRILGGGYQKIIETWPNCRIIGLSATPERTDGKGLDAIFDAMVIGPSIRELMDGGYLCEYDLLAPPSTVSMDNVRTVGGDYDADAAADIVDRPTITGDAVAHYQKHAAGQRCVVMAINLKHAVHIADAYNAAGIRAEVISGESTDRVAILKRFATGQTLVLVNVQLMIEGVDIPAIQAVQWLRPTKSLIVWMQGNGRGLRPADGKERLIILDHVGNWSRPGFGMPDAPREWSLAGRKERARREPVESFDVRQCPACYAVYRATLTVCPKCSTEGRKTQREIEVIAGELARVEAETAMRDRKREVGRARTLEELIQVGIRRGMSRPAEWAAHTVAAREGRKAGPADYAQAHRVHARMMMANA